MGGDSEVVLVIVTEGRHDVEILGALLESMGWQKQKEEKSGWARERFRVEIYPSEDERGGIGNIPLLISKYWQLAQRFLVVFDPDNEDPYRAIEDLLGRISGRIPTQIQNVYNIPKDRRLYLIRERNALLQR